MTDGEDEDEGKGKERTLGKKQIAMARRRESVRRMLPRRLTNNEMATLLAVSERTIEKDIAAIREKVSAEIERSTVMDIVADVRHVGTELERRAWVLFTAAKGPDGKTDGYLQLSVLQFLRQIRADNVRLLQSMGVVYEEPKVVQLKAEQRLIDKLRELPPETSHELAQIRDTDQFLLRITQLLGEEMVEALAMGGKQEIKELMSGSIAIEEDATDQAEISDE